MKRRAKSFMVMIMVIVVSYCVLTCPVVSRDVLPRHVVERHVKSGEVRSGLFAVPSAPRQLALTLFHCDTPWRSVCMIFRDQETVTWLGCYVFFFHLLLSYALWRSYFLLSLNLDDVFTYRAAKRFYFTR